MRSNSESKAIRERFAEARKLLAKGAHYSGLVRLAEIENCAANAAIESESAALATKLLGQVPVSSELMQLAIQETITEVRRLEKLLSGASPYEYEEVVLAITMGVQLELFAQFMKRRFPERIELDLHTVDELLRKLAESRPNKAVFASARSASKRNWGLRIQSKWLE